jgi:hypothetical protein
MWGGLALAGKPGERVERATRVEAGGGERDERDDDAPNGQRPGVTL